MPGRRVLRSPARAYKPRHAKPSRLRPFTGRAAIAVAICGPLGVSAGGPAASRTGFPLPADGVATAAALTFAADPMVAPLPARSLPLPAGTSRGHRPLPSAAGLLLPATASLGRPAGRPGRLPSVVARDYQSAAATLHVEAPSCGLQWQLLAALGWVASAQARTSSQVLLDGRDGWEMSDFDHGRYDGSTAFDGPVGPMQLLPWTWMQVSEGGAPTNLRASSVASGRYLCALGDDLATPTGERAALSVYSRDPWFPTVVIRAEASYIKR